jgi:hypothetical protein
VKCTPYFAYIRQRSDRTLIHDAWIERIVRLPTRIEHQPDGRIRCWGPVPEAGGRMLRVVLLADGETVHNAFFDRRFVP